MKITTLSMFFLFLIQSSIAQEFTQLCETEITNGTVVSFESYQDKIYATGFFSTICGQPAGYLAKWENGQWLPAEIGLSDPGHALRNINGKLYIARYEESIDSNWVYVYDGITLEKMGNGVYLTTASGFSELPNIYDIVEYDGQLIACGEFDRVDGQMSGGIMYWNGAQWEPLGSGFTGHIQNTAPVIYPHQMLVFNDALYVAGNFRYAGGKEVNGIARWNGTEWSSLGNGFNGTVYGITVYNGEIIAGGSFTKSGTQALDRIARWDGNQWSSMGFGFTETSSNDFIFVHTLKEIDGALYIAGGLKQVRYDDNSLEPCGGIVVFDGQSIQTFGGGVSGNDIEALIIDEEHQLLIGGGVFGNGYLGISNFSTPVLSAENRYELVPFPNPFDREIHWQPTAGIRHYTVTDMLGRSMTVGTNQDNTLDLGMLPSGMYMLILQGADQQYVGKILKR